MSDDSVFALGGADQKLREWYASFLGQSTLAGVDAGLARMLRATYGYHALQIGRFGEHTQPLLDSDLIHPMIMDTSGSAKAAVAGHPAALPFGARSLDLVVLFHTLELSGDPYPVLREVDRVLADDGTVIVVGFNRRSLWGLLRVLLGWRGRAPWNTRFFSLARVQDWLSVLGLRTTRSFSVGFAPPVNHAGLLRRLGFLERCAWLFPRGGAVYLLKARKTTVPLTPIKWSWSSRRGLVSGGFVRPTSGVGRVTRDQILRRG